MLVAAVDSGVVEDNIDSFCLSGDAGGTLCNALLVGNIQRKDGYSSGVLGGD